MHDRSSRPRFGDIARPVDAVAHASTARRDLPGPLEWLLRDPRTGAITIAQFPNAPLWIFLAATVVGRVAPGLMAGQLAPGGPAVGSAVDWIGEGALAWWALDEVIRGVNPWRRLLGLAGCVVVVTRLVALTG